ncbi:MAG TPA: alpha/beta fold hydrolase [Gemmatimonadaceae bacterium]|nr:alpha/beta fold hydrolase [Gemmatimonadaceae bacterium]
MPLALALLSIVGYLAPAAAAHVGDAVPCTTTEGAPLPLIERPSPAGSAPLVLLLTGDGGWAHADEEVAQALRARGSAVVGVNMRAYLRTRRSPDEAARDLACVARAYSQAWRRDRIILLGYSRGADIAPFAAARWPADLRARLAMVVLVSMSARANFQFHLVDLIRDVERPDDVALAPEIERLRGLNVLCVYGEDDRSTGCLAADTTVVRRVARPGGHRLTEGFDAIAALLAPALQAQPVR